jgi:hypothetical protein
VVEHVIPIAGDFSISTAQAKQAMIDTRHLSTTLASNQSRSGESCVAFSLMVGYC